MNVSVEKVLKVVDEILALLPTLVAAGASLAGPVTAIDGIWKDASIAHDDPRFVEYQSRIAAARAVLRQRAEELNDA